MSFEEKKLSLFVEILKGKKKEDLRVLTKENVTKGFKYLIIVILKN